METNELKFLLKLLGFTDYRAGLSVSAFDVFKTEKNKICKALGDRELVDYSREITGVKILPPGQALLKDPSEVPIKDKELKVLEKISKASGKIAPSKITSPKAAERVPTPSMTFASVNFWHKQLQPEPTDSKEEFAYIIDVLDKPDLAALFINQIMTSSQMESLI